MQKTIKITLLCLLSIILTTTHVFAAKRVLHLVVAYKTVYFAGKAGKAIAVNQQIPAPTLHFKQGDQVT
jgi:hypothetical protein